jgi:hypothetical protein
MEQGHRLQFSGLWEAVHALLNLQIDMAIVDEGTEVVLVENGFGDERDRGIIMYSYLAMGLFK